MNVSKISRVGALGAALLAGTQLALADASSATAAITAAQTDGLAVAGGLVSMGVAIWGAMFLYRKFFR